MKRLVIAVAAVAFSGYASAYEGSCFAKNNPDQYSGYSANATTSAEQPGVGDRMISPETSSNRSATSYDLWVSGNPDQQSDS